MNRVGRRAKRLRRGLYLAIGVVAFCVAVGGLGLHLERGQSKPLATLPPSSKEYVVKLNGAITPSSAGIIVALADGLFGRGGLSVSLLSGSGDADAIASAATDDHVIGLASAAGFLRARAEGSPIVAFAASYIVSSVEFYVLPNTRLLTPVRPRRKTDRILSGSGDIDYPPSFHHQKFNRPKQTRDRRERNRAVRSFEQKDRCADWPSGHRGPGAGKYQG